MSFNTISIHTTGERFYNITQAVQTELKNHIEKNLLSKKSGLINLFVTHTSCALTISEAFDPSAASDMEKFLQHLAPANLSFLTHTTEGPDDSPSHMKSIVLQPSLNLIVENGKILLGQWQGIYLAEFRHAPKTRKILLKFIADN